jgi:putative SOS response-associated peptidase YedK
MYFGSLPRHERVYKQLEQDPLYDPTDANDVVAPIHNRMPVILHPEDYTLWLDPDFDEKDPLMTLLKPYPAEAMEAYPVSCRVNKPSNNEPSCIESVA